jgi:hypothetical protein
LKSLTTKFSQALQSLFELCLPAGALAQEGLPAGASAYAGAFSFELISHSAIRISNLNTPTFLWRAHQIANTDLPLPGTETYVLTLLFSTMTFFDYKQN